MFIIIIYHILIFCSYFQFDLKNSNNELILKNDNNNVIVINNDENENVKNFTFNVEIK